LITKPDANTYEIETPTGHVAVYRMISGACLSVFGADGIVERQRFQMTRHEVHAAQALLTQMMQDDVAEHTRKGPPAPTRIKRATKTPTKRPKKKPVKRPRKTR
jgi:hypothetical protein